MDRLSKQQRSALMAKVRIKDTDIEKLLGEIIRPFWKKERYRKNVKNLPGKPDIVFPESKLAIFADGDFWHGKDFKKWESGIPAFWRKKIAGNILRDRLQDKALQKAGYCVLRFYGSKIKQNSQLVHNAIRRGLE
ncbi:MAG: very short patch repair endonuclease [bacterium]|nr:very short patch repair endonuclease [bacterium]